MKTKKFPKDNKSTVGPLFDNIRKPLAPPGQAMGHAKPEEKARPSGRKAKHKQRPERDD